MQALDIASAKILPDSATIGFVAKTITALFGGSFYVEETDRRSGIRAMPLEMPVGLTIGKAVDVGGTMQTAADERSVSGAVVVLH